MNSDYISATQHIKLQASSCFIEQVNQSTTTSKQTQTRTLMGPNPTQNS